MRQVRVNAIYDTIQGESTLAGMPCTLIRLAGCPLNCTYCDTPEAIPFDSGDWMPVDELVAQVNERARPLVLVTGGEPLAQRGTRPLLEALSDGSRLVQLETSGALPIAGLPLAVRRILDVKTPGSGEHERNRLENLTELRHGDEIKFVLTSRADYEWALRFILDHALEALGIPLLFSPAWGRLDARDLARWILEDRAPVRLQMQVHKLIWGAEHRHV